MKKFIIIIALTVQTGILYPQNQGVGHKFEILDPNHAGKIFRNPLAQISKPQGSPYSNPNFSFAKVENVQEKSKMRYNAYSDEIEFITAKNDTLILDRLEDFKDVTFVATNRKYKLVNYLNLDDKFQFGYLIDVYQKNDFGLFKKENIGLTDEKIAKTTLEQSAPAKYYQSSDTYFLKTKDKIFEFPSSRKKLSKAFLDKKDAIEAFVKENKIDFDNESDKIKIIDFLSTM